MFLAQFQKSLTNVLYTVRISVFSEYLRPKNLKNSKHFFYIIVAWAQSDPRFKVNFYPFFVFQKLLIWKFKKEAWKMQKISWPKRKATFTSRAKELVQWPRHAGILFRHLVKPYQYVIFYLEEIRKYLWSHLQSLRSWSVKLWSSDSLEYRTVCE